MGYSTPAKEHQLEVTLGAYARAEVWAGWGLRVAETIGLELIFRQNVLGANAAGRYEQQTDPQVLAARPYWMYDAVLDSGPTPICRGVNGIIRRADNSIWERIYPPNHFGCRAWVRSLTAREVAEKGGPTQGPLAVEVPPGFARPPTTFWEPDPSKYDPELWEALQGKHFERIDIGREILEVRAEITSQELDTIKRGVEGLNINRWLRDNPTKLLEVAPSFPDFKPGMVGEYDVQAQTVRVVYPRPEKTWGDKSGLGKIVAISRTGESNLKAASITLVHEFGHHLYLATREDLRTACSPATSK